MPVGDRPETGSQASGGLRGALAAGAMSIGNMGGSGENCPKCEVRQDFREGQGDIPGVALVLGAAGEIVGPRHRSAAPEGLSGAGAPPAKAGRKKIAHFPK